MAEKRLRNAPAGRTSDDAAGAEHGRLPPDRSRVFFTRGYRIGSDDRAGGAGG